MKQNNYDKLYELKKEQKQINSKLELLGMYAIYESEKAIRDIKEIKEKLKNEAFSDSRKIICR